VAERLQAFRSGGGVIAAGTTPGPRVLAIRLEKENGKWEGRPLEGN